MNKDTKAIKGCSSEHHTTYCTVLYDMLYTILSSVYGNLVGTPQHFRAEDYFGDVQLCLLYQVRYCTLYTCIQSRQSIELRRGIIDVFHFPQFALTRATRIATTFYQGATHFASSHTGTSQPLRNEACLEIENHVLSLLLLCALDEGGPGAG